MKTSRLIPVAFGIFLMTGAAAYAERGFNRADPFEFDPANTRLVQSTWLPGIGCPTDARISSDGTTYTDPACPTGDLRDRQNEGLLLVKTGPTANNASAGVVLTNVPSTVTELGYDIRKPGASTDPRGSHCGAGAPRFNVTTEDGTTFFIGCNSPLADEQHPGNGWLRLRWGGAVPLFVNVKKISIVFDEGQDTGPDNFGAAVLDNIDVNGKLVGQGPIEPGIESGSDGEHGDD